jgi:predicted dehydrogenase
MKVLLVGLGRWGKNHLKTLKRMDVGIYLSDVDEIQLKDWMCDEIPSDHKSTNYQDFISKVDAVVIATPTDSHLKICRDAFKRKKDVFVEKPIALTSKDAIRMVNESDKLGLILQVGHIYRYHPATSEVKHIIEEKTLGNIKYAYGHFMGFKRPRMDVGVTQTDAIHYFDLFNYLFGLPNSVISVTKNYLNLPLDDTSISILDYQGKMVLIEAGYLAPETKRDIAIIGDKGNLYCDFQKNHLVVKKNCHTGNVVWVGGIQEIVIKPEEPLEIELRAFIDSVRIGGEPLANGWDGYRALKIVEACYKSSKKGRRVEIEW